MRFCLKVIHAVRISRIPNAARDVPFSASRTHGVICSHRDIDEAPSALKVKLKSEEVVALRLSRQDLFPHGTFEVVAESIQRTLRWG